jgi:hypothetical protein
MAASVEVRPGTQLRRQALGTSATYAVIAVEGDLVVVEVVRAPGLRKGQRLKFTGRDARSMEQISSAQAQATASRPVLAHHRHA